MTKKAKGSAEAATSKPSQVQTPDKGHKNMTVDSTGVQKTPEDPHLKVTRIAKELSAALNEVEGYHMAIAYPSAAHQYPVMICLEKSYAQQMRALYAYREAWNALKPLMPNSQAYKNAKRIFRDAEWALQDTFEGEGA